MEEEFNEIDSRNAWTAIYQQIRQQSSTYKYTCQDARKVENKNLNRYRDVSPYDHTRVRLERGKEDYINASKVSVLQANRAYILTQGPLPMTTGHFWLMVWEQKSRAVLMLNRVLEKNAVKCHQYWPLGKCAVGGEEEMLFSDVSLAVTFQKETEASNYTIRELLLTDLESGEKRVILHFHYTSWPDFGVPESPSAFLDFLMAVRESGALELSVGPPVVHCSAGIGRSGTFCLVDSCLAIIEATGDPHSVSIQDLLLEMRKYRMGLIQTADQLRFSYLAILEGIKHYLTNNNNNNSRRSTPETTADGLSKEVGDQRSSNHVNSSPQGSSSSSEESPVTKDQSQIPEESPPPLPPRENRTTEPQNKEHNNCNNAPATSEQETNSLSREVRRRKRQEANEQLVSKVQRMRQKQQEAETSWKRRLLVKRLSFGIVILMGTSILVYRYYMKS